MGRGEMEQLGVFLGRHWDCGCKCGWGVMACSEGEGVLLVVGYSFWLVVNLSEKPKGYMRETIRFEGGDAFSFG